MLQSRIRSELIIAAWWQSVEHKRHFVVAGEREGERERKRNRKQRKWNRADSRLTTQIRLGCTSTTTTTARLSGTLAWQRETRDRERKSDWLAHCHRWTNIVAVVFFFFLVVAVAFRHASARADAHKRPVGDRAERTIVISPDGTSQLRPRDRPTTMSFLLWVPFPSARVSPGFSVVVARGRAIDMPFGEVRERDGPSSPWQPSDDDDELVLFRITHWIFPFPIHPRLKDVPRMRALAVSNLRRSRVCRLARRWGRRDSPANRSRVKIATRRPRGCERFVDFRASSQEDAPHSPNVRIIAGGDA